VNSAAENNIAMRLTREMVGKSATDEEVAMIVNILETTLGLLKGSMEMLGTEDELFRLGFIHGASSYLSKKSGFATRIPEISGITMYMILRGIYQDHDKANEMIHTFNAEYKAKDPTTTAGWFFGAGKAKDFLNNRKLH